MPKVSLAEENIIYDLSEKMTGMTRTSQKREVLVSNVLLRMQSLNINIFKNYLEFALNNEVEFKKFISALSIHTTSWFREFPHFNLIKSYIEKNTDLFKNKKVRIWSAACSTGEEVFSIALLFDQLCRLNLLDDYEILGTDIDSVCIDKARLAIYSKEQINQIPAEFRVHLREGLGKASKFFKIDDKIRNKCHFKVQNLIDINSVQSEKFDLIFCRNVLIYFNQNQTDKLIQFFDKSLNKNGLMILGHSEAPAKKLLGFTALGHSAYSKKEDSSHLTLNSKNVLIVDDSSTARKFIAQNLKENNFNVFLASTTSEADLILTTNKIDYITLDLNLKNESGANWLSLKRSLGLTIPVVIVSEVSAQDATDLLSVLENGAFEYVTKSELNKNRQLLKNIFLSAENKIINTPRFNYKLASFSDKKFKPEVILIGSSTGGIEALCTLLKSFPTPCPPVVVVQHITPEFLKPLSQRISEVSGLKLGSLEDKSLQKSSLYFAQDDYHIGISFTNQNLKLEKSNTPHMNHHRPSVDYLFFSAAKTQVSALAIILTGMGEDGAAGMLHLCKNGSSYNLVQNQQSCVIFGMPKKALELNAVHFCGNLNEIRNEILKTVNQIDSAKAS